MQPSWWPAGGTPHTIGGHSGQGGPPRRVPPAMGQVGSPSPPASHRRRELPPNTSPRLLWPRPPVSSPSTCSYAHCPFTSRLAMAQWLSLWPDKAQLAACPSCEPQPDR